MEFKVICIDDKNIHQLTLYKTYTVLQFNSTYFNINNVFDDYGNYIMPFDETVFKTITEFRKDRINEII